MAIVGRSDQVLGVVSDKKSFKQVEKDLQGVDKAVARIGGTALGMNRELKKAFDAKQIDKSAESVSALRKEFDKTAESVKKLSTLEQQEAAFRATSERVAAFGDIESGARTLGGGIGALGGETGQKIESAVAALSEIPAAIEALPRLAQATKGVAVRALAAVTAKKAQATAEATETVAATSAALSNKALALTLGAVAAVGVALVAAFALLNRAGAKAAERAKKLEEAYRAQAETSAELAVTLQEGDYESAITTYQDLLRQQAVQQEQFNDATLRAAGAVEEEKNAFEGITDLFGKSDLDAQAKEAKKTQEEASDALATTNKQVETAADLLRQYGIDVENIPTKAEAEKEKKLTEERKRATAAITDLEGQERDLVSKRQQALADQAQDRAIRDRREQEDAAEAGKKRAESLAKAEADGRKQLAEIRKDGAKQEADTLNKANQDIASAINDANDKRRELEKDYADAAIQAQNQFNERRAQAQRNFENAEFDAIQNNDIIAALRAQRSFEEQQQQEATAFAEEQAQRAQEKQERMAALQEEQRQRIAEIQANLQVELAAQKQALQERLSQEKAAIAERVAEQKKADAEAEKERQKRLKRQKEDDDLRDEREQRAFEEQLNRIEQRKQAEQQALQATFKTIEAGAKATIDVIGQANQAVITATGQVAQQIVTGIGNAANKSLGKGVQRRASGGRVDAGTLYKVNDTASRRTELFRPDTNGRIIPLAGNLANNARGGQTVNQMTINLTTADIATGQQVASAIQAGFRQYGQADIQIMADSLAGV